MPERTPPKLAERNLGLSADQVAYLQELQAGRNKPDLPFVHVNPLPIKPAAVVAPIVQAPPIMGNTDTTITGGTGASGPAESTNPGWDAMSQQEQAAYYAANPNMALTTQQLQNLFENTTIGKTIALLNPHNVAVSHSIAQGVAPSVGDAIGGFGGYAGANAGIGSDGASTGFGTTGTGGFGLGGFGFGGDGLGGMGYGFGGFGGFGDSGTGAAGDGTGSDGNSNGSDSTGTGTGDGSGGDGSGAGWKMGGLVTGPGTGRSDSIPAMLSNGEYVIPAHIVKAMGREYFDKLLAVTSNKYKGK